MKTLVITLATIFTLILSLPAQACLSLDAETRTFFEQLPNGAKTRGIVAKVEIISTETHTPFGQGPVRISKAKVVEAVKGTKIGSSLTIESEIHSCSRDPKIKAGQRYYIAGSIGKDGHFIGSWRHNEIKQKASDSLMSP